MSKQKLTVYLDDFLYDLLALEADRQNRSISNLSAYILQQSLSQSSILLSHAELAKNLGKSVGELELSTSPLDWPQGYQWLPTFQRWIPIMI